MPYTAPPGNAVVLQFGTGYTAPAPPLEFQFGAAGNSFGAKGKTICAFGGQAIAEARLMAGGAAGVVWHTSIRAVAFSGASTAQFVNPDRAVAFSGASVFNAKVTAVLQFGFSATGTAADTSFAGEAGIAAAMSSAGEATCAFGGALRAESAFKMPAASVPDFHVSYNKDVRFIVQGRSGASFKTSTPRQGVVSAAGAAAVWFGGTAVVPARLLVVGGSGVVVHGAQLHNSRLLAAGQASAVFRPAANIFAASGRGSFAAVGGYAPTGSQPHNGVVSDDSIIVFTRPAGVTTWSGR